MPGFDEFGLGFLDVAAPHLADLARPHNRCEKNPHHIALDGRQFLQEGFDVFRRCAPLFLVLPPLARLEERDFRETETEQFRHQRRDDVVFRKSLVIWIHSPIENGPDETDQLVTVIDGKRFSGALRHPFDEVVSEEEQMCGSERCRTEGRKHCDQQAERRFDITVIGIVFRRIPLQIQTAQFQQGDRARRRERRLYMMGVH